MGLRKEQRKQLAAVRKLIKSTEWADVKHGLGLLEAINDPELWRICAEGVHISSEGKLEIGHGEIKKRVKAAYRKNVALFAARHTGLLTRLPLSTSTTGRR